MVERPERDWDDDTEYHAALARAERLTRFSLTTTATLIALAVLSPLLLVALATLAVVGLNY